MASRQTHSAGLSLFKRCFKQHLLLVLLRECILNGVLQRISSFR